MNTNQDIIETMAKGNGFAKLWAEYESAERGVKQVADFASCYLLQHPLESLVEENLERLSQLRWIGLNAAQQEQFNTLLEMLKRLRADLLNGLTTSGFPVDVITTHKADVETERQLISKLGNEYLEMKDRFTDQLVYYFTTGERKRATEIMESWDKHKAAMVAKYK